MRRQQLLVGVMCAASVVLTGCSQSCHMIGGLPGLDIENSGVLVERHAVEVTVCVTETACATQPVTTTSVDGPLRVETELLSSAVTVVTISAVDAQGAEVLRESKPVTPTVSYPNGQGCDPAVWNATVIL